MKKFVVANDVWRYELNLKEDSTTKTRRKSLNCLALRYASLRRCSLIGKTHLGTWFANLALIPL